MCNNIPQNKLNLKKEERKENYSIESRTPYARPIMAKSVIAKNLKQITENTTTYISGHPLKLRDGTKIHEIKLEKLDDKYSNIKITYSFPGESKRREEIIKRYVDDEMEMIEEFLIHSFSIYELRNIDLNYICNK